MINLAPELLSTNCVLQLSFYVKEEEKSKRHRIGLSVRTCNSWDCSHCIDEVVFSLEEREVNQAGVLCGMPGQEGDEER